MTAKLTDETDYVLHLPRCEKYCLRALSDRACSDTRWRISEGGRSFREMGTLEIACDESGSEGEKLIGGNTEVFAHAGVLLTEEAAAECIRETRERIRSPATEYKANHLLRSKHRAVLVWLLSPTGPIYGRARVYLADKAFFAVLKIFEIAYDGPRGEALAVELYRAGPGAFGRERWTAFLETFNEVMRGRAEAEAFDLVVAELAGVGGRAGEIVGSLGGLPARRGSIPALDPLIPAIVQAVAHWGQGTRAVSIMHDQHNGLTEERIAHIQQVAPLAGLRLADSFYEPRVQVADFLAGVARKIAEEELNGRGDRHLVELLRPYVDPASVWGDERSWTSLGPHLTPSAR